jgi:putative mRNA 3-end processing factor
MSIQLSTAQASGWVQIRKMRKIGNLDKGFTISDHADWEGLNNAIKATEAELVYVTHGFTDTFARWLTEQGIEAYPLTTEFVGETDLPMEQNTFAD